MGYLPKVSSFRIRSVHTRGINRCISLGITDLAEIAKASGIPNAEIVDECLTSVQKMALGKAKKQKAREMKAEAEAILDS